jgi:hypothetical protein
MGVRLGDGAQARRQAPIQHQKKKLRSSTYAFIPVSTAMERTKREEGCGGAGAGEGRTGEVANCDLDGGGERDLGRGRAGPRPGAGGCRRAGPRSGLGGQRRGQGLGWGRASSGRRRRARPRQGAGV